MNAKTARIGSFHLNRDGTGYFQRDCSELARMPKARESGSLHADPGNLAAYTRKHPTRILGQR